MIMHAKYQYSIINTPEDMSQVKVFVTGQTEGQTEEWVLMSPAFAKRGGQKVKVWQVWMMGNKLSE